MGMFDYVRCEMPLDGNPPDRLNGAWQTKDTPDQYMTTYTIRSDGSLWWKPYETDFVPNEEFPEGDFRRLRGALKRYEKEPERLTDFHGDIFFYGGDWSNELQQHLCWWEYRARFTDGVCSSIKLVEHRAQQDSRP